MTVLTHLCIDGVNSFAEGYRCATSSHGTAAWLMFACTVSVGVLFSLAFYIARLLHAYCTLIARSIARLLHAYKTQHFRIWALKKGRL